MKCLAYCILPDQDGLGSVLPRNPEGAPLAVVVEEGLACVIARVSDSVTPPAASHLLGYARIIEDLAQRFSLLPMRYGSLLDSEDHLREWLRKRHVVFRTNLEKLEGCSEMGIRVLPHTRGEGQEPGPASEPQPKNGTAYLATRRVKYHVGEQQRQQAIRLCDEIRAPLNDLSRSVRTEQSTLRGHLLVSLHFLVLRQHIESFRAAFHQFQQSSSLKVLLSGPWPPYNFAASD